MYALSRLQTINYPSTSIYCSYICCALPQRSRLSIDRLSRCHHRLPTCLLAMPNVTSLPRPCRPHRRLPRSSITSGASCRYRNAEGSRAHLPGMPVMNPRPHLALSFAHRRRLLFIFRLLYHALVGLPNWPDLRPCHTLLHANAHPGPTSDGGYRRRSLRFIVVSSRLLLSTSSRYRHCSCRATRTTRGPTVQTPVRARE